MYSALDRKRDKFSNDKRRQIHEKMFELNRQFMNKDFNASQLIPYLLDEDSFAEIDAILDQINTED